MVATRVLLACLALSSPFAVSAQANTDAHAQLRALYQAAHAALRNSDQQAYAKLRPRVVNYALYPYLEFAELSGKLLSTKSQVVDDFLRRYADTPLAGQMRRAWLQTLAKRKAWGAYRRYYRPTSNVRLRCWAARARLAKADRKGAFVIADKLWLHGKSRPSECDPVFASLRATGELSTRHIWQRFELAMQAGELKLARHLEKLLPRKQRSIAKRWRALRADPGAIQAMPAGLDRRGDPLTRYAVARLARRDPQAAIAVWQNLTTANPRYSRATRVSVSKRIGISLATAHHAQAYPWLAAISDTQADKTVREWRIRSALRHNRWSDVSAAIKRLLPAERNTTQWRYWGARADAMLGRRSAAAKTFAALAERREFYGFLAADRAGLGYHINHQPLVPDATELTAISARPAAVRVREFLYLNDTTKARREWFAMLAKLTPKAQTQSAILAHRWNWHAGAILTLGRIKQYADAVVRFPLEHQQQVLLNAKRWNLPAAWIFAVMRQESAFMADARSPVGARGLMQIMPATGRQIARTLRVRYTGARSLAEPTRNILFGSSYLSGLLASLDQHPALATAGYNAGPHRSKRWLPATALESDQWIETIPFHETRRYVKSVFAYEAIYQWRLEQEQVRLSERLPQVPVALGTTKDG